MRLTDEIKHFIASPVMIIVGTRDTTLRPAIGRGVGARVVDANTIDVMLSAWQWPDTIANLNANGRAAVTFARPSDYVSYQLKGDADLRAAEPADLDLARRYREAVLGMFAGLGLPAQLVLPWLVEREPVIARIAVREAYVQTPGPKAGTVAGVAG